MLRKFKFAFEELEREVRRALEEDDFMKYEGLIEETNR